ncbi:uncharacterized protein LOC105172565 isoform X2 [Sesamum indicum]|uniref:Uncharacterized protein LOC105172565 isoform X2 n=1 Tax=Sesamum indicum TaxID=4182 RepID=A0A6I9UDW9_SESIN|nr:uncharacterized protein LOC105172565 isoform X2 [Sesamum indicum]
MGKVGNRRLPVVQQQASRTFLCRRCSVAVYSLISFKCAVVLTLSIAAFLSALFWVLPVRYRQAGFDAKDSIKLRATVQAYFRLQKPVSKLVPYIARLEYDLNGEIGVPSAKVAIMSMHQEGKSNWTDVVLGFLPDPINSTINLVSLSLLKSSLIDLFLQQYNLTLNSSLFGDPSSFEIFRVAGGITIIPEGAALILQAPQVLFNFTLSSSIYEIKENLLELKRQLKFGLHLMPNEVVYIQLTNKHGSTIDCPVTVQASVVSDLAILSLERLRQLARVITGHAENLGLDHSVFGKVKEISLSSLLNHSLHAPTPTPSLSPSWCSSPEQIYDTGPSAEPSSSPTYSPNLDHSIAPCPNYCASAPSDASQPLLPTPQNLPSYSLPPTGDSPKSSVPHGSPDRGPSDPLIPSPSSCSDQMPPSVSPLGGSTHRAPPSLSPLPGFTYDYQGLEKASRKDLVLLEHVASSSASFWSSGPWRIQWFNSIGIPMFLLLIWIS